MARSGQERAQPPRRSRQESPPGMAPGRPLRLSPRPGRYPGSRPLRTTPRPGPPRPDHPPRRRRRLPRDGALPKGREPGRSGRPDLPPVSRPRFQALLPPRSQTRASRKGGRSCPGRPPPGERRPAGTPGSPDRRSPPPGEPVLSPSPPPSSRTRALPGSGPAPPFEGPYSMGPWPTPLQPPQKSSPWFRTLAAGRPRRDAPGPVRIRPARLLGRGKNCVSRSVNTPLWRDHILSLVTIVFPYRHGQQKYF